MTVDVLPIAETVLLAGFMCLAVLAVSRAAQAGSSGWWIAGCFASLAVALVGFWVPEWLGAELPGWATSLLLVLMLAFPYLLFRFAATFEPFSRAVEAAVLVGTVVAVGVILTSLRGGSGGPGAEPFHLFVVFGSWVAAAMATTARLWQAGRGQPGVARRRMRWMAVATGVLTMALVTVVGAADRWLPAELVGFALADVSMIAFALGFAPPRSLRLSWRLDEDRHLRGVASGLLSARTADEVAAHLVPATLRITGATGAVLIDAGGRTVAAGGAAAHGQRELDADERLTRQATPVGEGHGELVAWTSRYAPFFAAEETALFRTLGDIGGLALERCALLAEERHQRAELEAARVRSDAALTEAQQARREADAANLAKTEFLSRMSHELRTPLNAILGFGQLLETSELNEDDRIGVDYILKAGRHLLALIQDVLDLSRIEAGSLTISPEPVHVGELVADSIALIRPLAASRRITLNVDREPCNRYVLTDRQRCRQVLLNLLSNAVKYNHDDGDVDVRCELAGDERLRISVRDTGSGIEATRIPRLFEPFDRLGAETSGVEGTGLGLALTKQLVERLGGAIGVDSQPGQGSTFWVDLPVATPPEELADSSSEATPAEETDDHVLLLVEDNLANLRVVEAMLRRRSGISVLPAMQGTLALELAYEHLPDVIVLDIHLPDLSGRDVLNRLKADPRTRRIPVIIASADATPGRIRQLKDDGAFAFIPKPLDLTTFLRTVDQALEKRDQPG